MAGLRLCLGGEKNEDRVARAGRKPPDTCVCPATHALQRVDNCGKNDFSRYELVMNAEVGLRTISAINYTEYSK
jgi:hypothetical protein